MGFDWNKEVPVSGGGRFIKVDTAPIEVQFTGEPTKEIKHFMGGPPAECTGPGCRVCALGDKPTLKFKYPVLQSPSMEEKILDLSLRAIQDLKVVRDTMSETLFRGSIFSCQRMGSGKMTRYQFTPKGQAPKLDALPF